MTQQFNIGDKVQFPINDNDDNLSTFEITDVIYSDVIGTHTYKLNDGINTMWVNEILLRFYNTPPLKFYNTPTINNA